MTTNKIGRPPKVTELLVKKLEEAFMDDMNITEACVIAGISRKTYYELIEKRQDLGDKFEALRQNVKIKAKRTVSGAVTDDPKIALRYLKARSKEYKDKLELSGELQVNPITDMIDKITAAAVEKVGG